MPETGPQPVAPDSADVQPGTAAGAVKGVAEGVVGGVAGGLPGGVVGGRGTEPLPVNQVAKPPILLTRVMPEYPPSARRRGIEGLVVLEAVLDHDGRIEDHIKVLQSIPFLDEAAIRALRQWRFRPARDHHHRSVQVILEVPIRFELK